jgi:hypothetical protein
MFWDASYLCERIHEINAIKFQAAKQINLACVALLLLWYKRTNKASSKKSNSTVPGGLAASSFIYKILLYMYIC